MRLESEFQRELIKEIKERFKGAVVLKTDPNYIQGFPDLLILYKNNWLALECKRNVKASLQPNQKYYLEKLNNMSYARLIYPECKEEVLNEIQQSFGS